MKEYNNEFQIGQEHSRLHSTGHSKNNKSFKIKIHYITMILYLNYKNNVYKVENVNGVDVR